MLYPPGSEINAVSHSTFDILTFSVSEKFMELLAQKMGFPGFKRSCRNVEIFTCNKNDMEIIRFLLKHMSYNLKINRFVLNEYHRRDFFMNTVSGMILTAICQNKNSLVVPKQRARDKAYEKAMQYIHTFAGEDFRITDLARQTDVSQRTLEYIFKERLHLSPKKYSLVYRLNRVRSELMNTSADRPVITDIAGKWGFWHMGQFAKDYKKFFFELPSKTLNKSKYV